MRYLWIKPKVSVVRKLFGFLIYLLYQCLTEPLTKDLRFDELCPIYLPNGEEWCIVYPIRMQIEWKEIQCKKTLIMQGEFKGAPYVLRK